MKKRAFTLIELLVVISIIAVLMAILMPTLRKAKEGAARVACLSNQKQLGLAWAMYAQNNDDMIVYGGTLAVEQLPAAEQIFHQGETPWVYHSLANDTDEVQGQNIQRGALWPYIKSLAIYRCPAGEKGKLRTYSIVDGLNSINWMPGTQDILVKKLTQLRRSADRVVFIDEGGGVGTAISTMGWCIYYTSPRWWDLPPVRHREGTTLSFADGHAEYRRWEDKDTKAYSDAILSGRGFPAFQPYNPDLLYMQKGVWGRIGYEPEQFR